MSDWYVSCIDISEGQVRTGEIKIGQAGHSGRVNSGLVQLRQVESGQVIRSVGQSGGLVLTENITTPWLHLASWNLPDSQIS